MNANRERTTPRAWALGLVFVAFALLGAERLVDTVFVDDEPVAWAQGIRIASCVLALASSLAGIALTARARHRGPGTFRLALADVTSEAPDEAAAARAVTRTFPLTLCVLLLALAVTAYVATFPNEPAFVRVVSFTGVLIALLWIVGTITTQVRTRRRLGSRT